MTKDTKKSEYAVHEIVGRFDSKTASGLMEKLEPQLRKRSVAGAVLDFSAATHMTASGMTGLKWLGEQLHTDGKKLVVRGMRSEMYKALKIAGVPEALEFSHRTVPPSSC